MSSKGSSLERLCSAIPRHNANSRKRMGTPAKQKNSISGHRPMLRFYSGESSQMQGKIAFAEPELK
jgi:hypothetical protein